MKWFQKFKTVKQEDQNIKSIRSINTLNVFPLVGTVHTNIIKLHSRITVIFLQS